MGFGTFQGLEIAKSGMMAYNVSMQTAAHNLANIGTNGYSRQVVRTSAQTRHVSSIKVVGSGVCVQGIERMHNEYYDTNFEKATATFGKYSTHAYYLNEIQRKLYSADDKTGGITNAFDTFCTSLTQLPDNAGEQSWRKKVISYGDTFTRFVQETATYLQNLQDEANVQIKSSVDQINAIADQIVSVTKQINTLEAYGNIANDLRDQRTVLLDELSEYCNIKVLEEAPAEGVGMNRFYVYIDGATLIDTLDVNKLVITENENTKNINDIDGLYNVTWADGTPFHPYSSTLGGTLQALFQVRDGNNATTLHGLAQKGSLTNDKEGNLVVTMTSANINDVNLLNIPADDGEITIGNYTYNYKDFKVDVSETGEFSYTFTLKNDISASQATVLERAVNEGRQMIVGDSVDYKGVPYYMAQLNEFVRTYAQAFNGAHKEGYDANGNKGIDFFNATVPATGDNYIFTQKDKDGHYSSFTSVAQKEENGSYTGSYYYMTALNVRITDAVLEDQNLFACYSEYLPGESQNINIHALAILKDDSKMFLHGAPDAFLQSFTADIAVDCQKAQTLQESQKNIKDAVALQRQSVSGADEDEETENLLTFQRLTFHQYKVLSVMNEVLDKLINQTAV